MAVTFRGKRILELPYPVRDHKSLTKDELVTFAERINVYAEICRSLSDKWWRHPCTNRKIKRNRGEQLMLVVTEIAEAMEGERKGINDTHLKKRRMAEVELADAIIRILEYAHGHGYDLGGALVEKLLYNAVRKDHSRKARLAPGGKKC